MDVCGEKKTKERNSSLILKNSPVWFQPTYRAVNGVKNLLLIWSFCQYQKNRGILSLKIWLINSVKMKRCCFHWVKLWSKFRTKNTFDYLIHLSHLQEVYPSSVEHFCRSFCRSFVRFVSHFYINIFDMKVIKTMTTSTIVSWRMC